MGVRRVATERCEARDDQRRRETRRRHSSLRTGCRHQTCRLALAGWTQIPLDELGVIWLRQGRAIEIEGEDAERVAACDSAGEVVGIGRVVGGTLQPVKVLV